LTHNFHELYEIQIKERINFHYPPFFRLIRLTVKHRDEQICKQASTNLGELLRKQLNHRVLGPDIPTINRIQNLYLRNILIKLEKQGPIKKFKETIDQVCKQLLSTQAFKSVVVIIDVDPY
jgi:primosomal protein N' (replication factor Y)